MDNQTILNKAIEKAMKDGLDWLGWGVPANIKQLDSNKVRVYMYEHEHWDISIRDIIFSHDFAKTFWNSTSCFHEGKEYRHVYDPDGFCKQGQAEWQYHLQQMVLEEEPLKYLERFI